MNEARFRPDDFRQMGQEGDDVVLGLALDLLDARNIELGVLALGPDLFRRFFRDDPELGHGVGGMRLDLEPDAKARFRRPDRRHFRAGVARIIDDPQINQSRRATFGADVGGYVWQGEPIR